MGEPPDLVAVQSSWPDEPYESVDGVREAAGDPVELAEAAAGAHAIVTHLAPVTAAVLESAQDTLRVVGSVRGGPVNIDVEAATRLGVPVAYLPGRNLGAVAEFCVGHHDLRDAGPARRGPRPGRRPVGRDRVPLPAHRPGAAGRHRRAGRPRRRRAAGGRAAARPSGRRCSRTTRTPTRSSARAAGVQLVALDELLAAQRRGQPARAADRRHPHDVRRRRVRRDEAGLVFVNTARGELVDQARPRRGAGLGPAARCGARRVRPRAARQRRPAARRAGVFATPHLAGASRQVAEESAAKVAAEIVRVLTGGRPLNCANPEVLSR